MRRDGIEEGTPTIAQTVASRPLRRWHASRPFGGQLTSFKPMMPATINAIEPSRAA